MRFWSYRSILAVLCSFGLVACISSDDGGSSRSSDDDATADSSDDSSQQRTGSCNDGSKDDDELCDGSDLGGLNCTSLGYTGGTLRCNSTCNRFILDACESDCTTDCSGLVCGADRLCGLSCGVCISGPCLQGECVDDPVCTRDCGTRVCGPDPECGESCGTCEEGVCDEAGLCQVGDPEGPEILTFATNVTRITQNESVIITALVSDPDGTADLVGGTLAAPGGSVYGSFVASSPGSYSLTLSWSAIQQVEAIEFEDVTEISRTFNASFLDSAGHSTGRSFELALHCDGLGACDGRCTNLETTSNCGQCDNECSGEGHQCVDRACDCPEDELFCDDYCVRVTDNPDRCGSCDPCPLGQTCTGTTCTGPKLSDCFLESESITSCAQYCEGRFQACYDAEELETLFDGESCFGDAAWFFETEEDCTNGNYDWRESSCAAEMFWDENIWIRCCCGD